MMKKTLLFMLFMLLGPALAFGAAGDTTTLYNPFTGKLDYVLDVSQLASGANDSMWNLSGTGLVTAGAYSVTIPGDNSSGNLVVKSVLSQTANLIDAQNNSGSSLAYIDSSGNYHTKYGNYFGGTGGTGDVRFVFGNSNLAYINLPQVGYQPFVYYYATGADNYMLVEAKYASANPLIVKGASSQSGNLQTWKDSSDTILLQVEDDGRLYHITGGSQGSPAIQLGATNLGVYKAATNVLGLIAAGNPVTWNGGTNVFTIGQWASGNPMTFQSADTSGVSNRAATPLFIRSGAGTGTGADGYIKMSVHNNGASGTTQHTQVDSLYIDGGSGHVGIYSENPGASLHVENSNATDIGIIVRGNNSQSANLQEWQNSSSTTTLAISPQGYFDMGTGSAYAHKIFDIENAAGTNAMTITGDTRVYIGADTGVDAQLSSSNPAAAGNRPTLYLIDYAATGNPNIAFRSPAGLGDMSIDTVTGVDLMLGHSTAFFAELVVAGDGSEIGRIGVHTQAPKGALHIDNWNATQPGLIVEGFTAQSSNLQEWHDVSSNVLLDVNASGVITTYFKNQNVSLSRMAMGEMYNAEGNGGNTAPTVISASDTWYNVTINTTQDPELTWCFSMPKNNTLQYICKDPKLAHVGSTLSVTSAGANDVYRAAIFKNNVLLPGSIVEERLAATGSVGSTAIHVYTIMQQYDNLTLAIQNDVDADDLTVKYFNLFAVGMSAGQDTS